MDQPAHLTSKTLRHSLLASSIALVGALMPATALAQLPFFDLGGDEGWGDSSGDDETGADPSALLTGLAGQATQLLGRAATSMPAAAPMLTAPAAAAPAPAAPAIPMDPSALISAAQGLTALQSLQSGGPADFANLPQAYQQQILAVLQQAQQQQAAIAHRFTPGSRAATHRQQSLRRRTDARIASIVSRAQRANAAAERRAARANRARS